MDDPDGDGVPTSQEKEMGTNSEEFDTDGDGSGDAVDGDPTGTGEAAGGGGGGSNDSPVLTLLSLGNIELGTHTDDVVSALSGAIVTATDSEDGTITDDVSITHDYVSGSAAHGTVVTATYSVTDSDGNTTTEELTTTVQDTVDPVITGHTSNISVVVGATPTESDYLSGITATDLSTPVTFTVNSSSADTSATGNYTITITAQDAVGNTATENRTVDVVEASQPVLTLSRITNSGTIIRHGGLIQQNNFNLVDHPNGGIRPGAPPCNGVAVHAGTQEELNLGGTRYGNAFTASLAINDEFTTSVLYLDGNGDYVEFPESSSGGGATWNTRYCNGDFKYDLNPARASANTNNTHRYHEVIGWFQFDQLHTGAGTSIYTIMNKKAKTGSNRHGYEIYMELKKELGVDKARLVYYYDPNGNDSNDGGTAATDYKDVNTDLWYVFRISTKTLNEGGSSGHSNVQMRAAFQAQNETGSTTITGGVFGTSAGISNNYNNNQLRIGLNQEGTEGFNGKLLRIQKWYALSGSAHSAAGAQSTNGGLQDWVAAANLALDHAANIRATNADEFEDPLGK